MTVIRQIGTRQDFEIKQGSDFGPINFTLSNGAINGDFSLLTQYIVNDEVVYNSHVYKCILASLGNLPTNATYWEEIAPPIDLTNANIRAQMRKFALSDEITATFIIEKLDSNSFNLSLPNAVTKNIPCGESIKDAASQYVWDMEMELNGYIQPLFYGNALVFREVTK